MVLKVDVKSVILTEEKLSISTEKTSFAFEIGDVIGCHFSEEPASFLSGLFGFAPHLSIRYISKGKNYRWSAETVQVTGSKEECVALKIKVDDKLGQEKDRPKKLGVFINPIGGNQDALSVYGKVVSPLLKTANISCDVNVSERPKHMIDLVNSFDTASVDGLVVMGGDGTVLEVFNTLLTRVQKEADLDYDQPTCRLKPLEIPIGIIPTGTGNGAANGLYGNMDIVTAALHIIKGQTNHNNIQAVYSGGKLVSFSAVVVACCLFPDLMYEIDRLRWMKRARYVVSPFLGLFKKLASKKIKCTIFPGKHPSNGTDSEDSMEAKEIERDVPLFTLMSCYGDFYNNATDSKLDFVAMSRDTRKTGLFTLLAIKETSKLSFMSCFMYFKTWTRALYEKDCISPYTVKGYKVKILGGEENPDPDSQEARMRRLLDVDGELRDITNGEYEVWNHKSLMKFYTSH